MKTVLNKKKSDYETIFFDYNILRTLQVVLRGHKEKTSIVGPELAIEEFLAKEHVNGKKSSNNEKESRICIYATSSSQ